MKICIVGYGSIGRRHHTILKDIYANNAKFVIIDVDTALTIDDVCNDIFDILVICTPTISHLEIASKFSNIRKLIFIEKPLDASCEKISKLKNTIDIDKVHVGCNIRFTEAYKEIANFKDTARIVNVVSMSYMPTWRNGINHLMSYSANSKDGGGVILDFIHEPDYIASIFNYPKLSYVSESRIFDGITNDASDVASIIWKYDDKVINFCLSYGCKSYKRYVEIIDNQSNIVKINITKNDIEASYRRQWDYILESGPLNTYDGSFTLLKILDK